MPGFRMGAGSRYSLPQPTKYSQPSQIRFYQSIPRPAKHYAAIASSRERAGKPIAGFDALIAAVCRCHSAALLTRNVTDFDGTGIEVIDPWLQSPG
jgi:predicted nucleic acid-binding protein